MLEKDANSHYLALTMEKVIYKALGDHVDGGTSRFDDNGVIYPGSLCLQNAQQHYIFLQPRVYGQLPTDLTVLVTRL